jgi:GntR family transcriptional regulator
MVVQDGLAVARRPLGYFVRQLQRLDWPVHDFEHGEPADAWVAVVREQGGEPHQEIRVEIIRPAVALAERLGLAEGELAVVRRRVRFVDGQPYALNDSYYPEPIVRGTAITDPADIPTGARHVLAALGHRWSEHEDQIEGRAPTDEEVTLLDIPAGLQVLVHTRTSANGDGVPSRVMVSVLPTDRWRLVYRVRG